MYAKHVQSPSFNLQVSKQCTERRKEGIEKIRKSRREVKEGRRKGERKGGMKRWGTEDNQNLRSRALGNSVQ